MAVIEERLAAMGLSLPGMPVAVPGAARPPYWIRVRNGVAWISGQSARTAEGKGAGPYGKVPTEVSIEQGREAAKGAGLALLATLKHELGDLDRVTAWLNVQGMVNAEPGFTATSAVINGFSEFIIELFGPEVGAHARASPGMAALPGNAAVVISAQVEVDGGRAS